MPGSNMRANLASSGLQKTNNPLYQLLDELIRQQAAPAAESVTGIYFIPVNTSVSAQSVDLKSRVKGHTIIKDSTGNAAAHNITLVGTVDGVVNPVINTNYGMMRVVAIPAGGFVTW
jgi:hypothetical protein